MKKTLTAALLCSLFWTGASAQERSFGTLPMGQKAGAKPTSAQSKMERSPKYLKALEIYNKLVAARGDARFPVPAFSMKKEERQVAYIDYDALEITLEEKAYDICMDFDADSTVSKAALAFLLSHELTHYYEKHAWRSSFAWDSKNLDLDISKKLRVDTLIDDAANETEADYLGGFLAYSAGYGLFDKGDVILDKLHSAYPLDTTPIGYPSLKDRKALSKKSAEKMTRLIEVFDMANMLTAIGNYSEAYEYYRHVLNEYQSREIYNNLGVTACLDAMQYFNSGELKYRYPLELDLSVSGRKGNDGMGNNRDKLLRQAIMHFDAAISLDNAYGPAYLNKACAYALLGDKTRAAFYAAVEAQTDDIKKNYPNSFADVDVLLGILAAQDNKTEEAARYFQSAKAAGRSLGDINLKILENKPLDADPEGMATAVKVEKIEDMSISKVIESAKFDPKRVVTIQKNLLFKQNPKQGAQSKLWYSENNRTGKTTYFQTTNTGYANKTARGKGVGDSRADIAQAYGEPEKTYSTPLGEIMVYPKTLFIIGADGKLERWVNYLVEE
jgi:tetratricopeptide (TPR) repeat protein